jgi:Fe2+ or Zn2+ uptake regulation protein
MGDGDANPISKSTIRKLLLRVLTSHQILILKELKINGHYFSVTNLIERLSEKHNIPPSTLRWNLKRLVDLRFIIAGNSKSKGIPVRLTDSGKLVCKILGGENKWKKLIGP